MSSNSQLLILGNGFDLQCGLKSSFNDFMKTRLAKVREVKESIKVSKHLTYINITGPDGVPGYGNLLSYWLWKRSLTVWDFILYEDRQQRTWYDIEDCIRTWVDYRLAPDNASYKSHIQQICLDYGKFDQNNNSNSVFPVKAEQYVLMYACELYRWDGQPGTLLDILLRELHRYEQVFANYLQEQVDKNSEYLSRAASLLTHLVNDQTSIPTFNTNISAKQYKVDSASVNILDFNYTYPIIEDWRNKPTCLNVHGLANKRNIIFGIDGTKLNTDHEYYTNIVKFTKTYRLMALSSRPHRSLVRPYLFYSPGAVTDMIKFFGHSLGDADYSYFQAIFDEVDLYESDTRLIFYYNQHRLNDEEETRQREKSVREEMFEKVNRLIVTYGQTQNNKDHGKNLLHKLLLEGRLTIKQAPMGKNKK
ncbi:AbiH family protein [Bifidobacterium asteroides]|uniref:Bacteriophage abortive infection AbiH n=1 Tax=Bifidobacterium asteroides TaxID=1684 RepID=A0A2N3RC73_9BIFI|nr:AbiH family protein [Bifidobacterium asteroides]PKV10100.1 Bacteriophage abortive infection AbiH [Bifidobacterium asteroides]